MKYRSFEDYLLHQHAKQYLGFDDEMCEDYEDWLANLEVDEFIRYGDEYAKAVAA